MNTGWPDSGEEELELSNQTKCVICEAPVNLPLGCFDEDFWPEQMCDRCSGKRVFVGFGLLVAALFGALILFCITALTK